MDKRTTTQQIIDTWDPMGLLAHAPKDEYAGEIAEIEKSLPACADADALGERIYRIFALAFGIENFQKSRAECKSIAKKILSAGNGDPLCSFVEATESVLSRQEGF